MKKILLFSFLMLLFIGLTTAQTELRPHNDKNEVEKPSNLNKLGPAQPEIAVFPDEFKVYLKSGEKTTKNLLIYNTGDAAENLDIQIDVLNPPSKQLLKGNPDFEPTLFGKALDKPNIVHDRIPSPGLETTMNNKLYTPAKNYAKSDLKKLFFDDFESGMGDWYTETYSGSDIWHISSLQSYSPNRSLWCGVEGGTTYNTGARVNTAVISPLINLPNTDEIYLDFWETFATESGWDYCMVDISTDDGSSWTHLRGSASGNSAPSGNSGGWVNTVIDLAAYAGENIRIRFYFDTKDGVANDYPGWFVDDVAIMGKTPWLSVEPANYSLSAGEHHNFNVVFDAGSLNEGVYEGIIRISSNDPSNPSVDIPATLYVDGNPQVSVSAQSLDFGACEFSVEETLPLSITNTGTADLELTQIKTSLSKFSANVSQLTIEPGVTKQIQVSFLSAESGVFEGNLTFKTNAPGQENFSIALYAYIEAYMLSLEAVPTLSGELSGAGEYQPGDAVSISAAPNEGYMFLNWTNQTGDIITTETDFAFNMPSEDLTFYANFTNKIPKISVNPNSFEENLLAGETSKHSLIVSNIGVSGSELEVFLTTEETPIDKLQTDQEAKLIKGGNSGNESIAGNIIQIHESSDTENAIYNKSEKAGGISVLYASAMGGSDTEFGTLLQNLPNVGYYEKINAASVTPNVAYMSNFDVVIVTSNIGFSNATQLGNNLADYADLGGGVILMNASFCTGGGWTLAGRIVQPDYAPLTRASYSLSTVTTDVIEPHAITSGVDNISTGIYSYSNLQGTGISLGTLSSGHQFAAYNPDKSVVGINIFPNNGYWSGDLDILMENTINWLNTSWLHAEPSSANVQGGSSYEFDLKFNATNLNEGTYQAKVNVHSNDPDKPVVNVPVTLHVTGFAGISTSSDNIDFGFGNLGVEENVPFTISNPGSAELKVTNIKTNSEKFYTDKTELNLKPGESDVVMVSFYSEQRGAYEGKLEFKTNAEGKEFFSVPLSAEIIAYKISLSALPSTGGDYSGQGFYHTGEMVSISAAPNAGYEFLYWEEGANKFEANPFEFEAQKDRSFKAVFGEIKYDISVSAAPSVAGIASGGGTYSGFDFVTVNASPNEGYYFVNWTEGAVEVSTNSNYSFTPSSDRFLVANFAEITTQNVTFNVDMSAEADYTQVWVYGESLDGTVWFESEMTDPNADDIYTVTLELDSDDYIYIYYYIDETFTDYWEASIREFSVIDDDVVLNNVWNNLASYTVNYSQIGGNGSFVVTVDAALINDGDLITEGKKVEFTASPDPGFRVKEWTYNGDIVPDNTNNNFVVANLGEDINVTVEFIEIQNHTVNFSVGAGNGSISATVDDNPISDGDVFVEGTEVVFNAVPASNSRVKRWRNNGVTVPNNVSKQYVLSSLNDNVNVTVEFEAIPSYTVQFGVEGTGGSLQAVVGGIEISSGEPVREGKDVLFEAKPEPMYRVKEWVYNTTPISNNTTARYGIYSLSETANVKVEFEKYLYTLTFNVLDADGIVEGARITIQGQSLTTDAAGTAEINLQNGSYNYTVASEGYESFSDNVSIDNADEVIDINLTALNSYALNASISLYPNPTDESVLITSPYQVTLEVLDITGKLIQQKVFTGEIKVDILTAGMYFFRFSNEYGTETKKVIVR